MNFLFRNKSITFLNMCGMALGATSFSYLYTVAIREPDNGNNKVNNKVNSSISHNSLFKLKKY
jgi:hypothetical protein